ncbi:succinate-semialdehyde dehydrogenase / glutarate-semialdehyde dehydrogenase [Paraburkholderia fungorum]|uniref:Succinate-semialdehyde dehydrogenase / glutarate-semialdehyde dehydrogenase n=1 Tax=Paraburkholderia fungorum TaxID=134537 RepID=A0A1H1JL83_9BURK|nr:aldehyde dehydrogenase family protein [Paraburkholderia fungorum]SDR50771.1 succinate-semialdehyde dehydrogenase / glutarate-semialdehyde dehydrogenase [Paraburkholderia fungorum]
MTESFTALPEVRLLIDGEWTDGVDRMAVLDKYRLTQSASLHIASREQVHSAVTAAHRAFAASTLTPYERGAVLERAAVLLERDSQQLVAALQTEGGFTLTDAQGEIKRCLQTFRLSAEEARRLAGDIVPLDGAPQQSGRLGFTIRVPLGVVCAITPFNAPLNTVAHKVAPALAAGNAVVLKPSTHTPTLANLMASCLLEAGLPPGLITVLHGAADVAGWLIDEPAVRFFAFTGSTDVGRSIQQRAGLRRTQMELGSLAFTIVGDDANLDQALPKIVAAGYRKAGQVCTSIQMLLVQRSRLAEVKARLTELVGELRFGDPRDPSTLVGPVISLASAERIERWIDDAVTRGATRLVGGAREGAVVPPTLLADVDPASQVSCQEVFGPVMSLVPFDTLDEAIDRVNATPYGLATGIFTNRLDAAFKAARRLHVGGVHINETSSSRVDLMPYGGSKDSGFGREGPHYAVREMSEERLITLST